MNIGFDAKRAFYNRSGLGNYSRHTIDILSRFEPENNYFLYAPIKRNPVNTSLNQNTKAIFPRGMNKLLYRSWRTHRIVRDLKRDNIQIYHGLSNELPYTIKNSGIRSVVTIHDLIFMRYPEFYYKHDREIYKSKFLKSCQNADKIIAISEQTKKDIVFFFDIEPEKIEVVYQGCDPIFRKEITDAILQEIKSTCKLPDQYILNVGTIENRKNIFSVIQAMHQHNINIPLVIIGRKTAYFNEINAYIEKNDLSKQFIFFHNLPFSNLPAFYRLSSGLIYPSVFEGFGIPIVEALTTGVPVITNKEGCFREAGGPDSLYIDPSNSDEIASAIRTLLSDQEKRQQMIEKGSLYVEKFSEAQIAANLTKVYKSVL